MPKKLLDWLTKMERILTGFTAVIMLVLSILICYQVFARYVLNNSPFWIEETSVIGMMWIGLLGAAGCVWTDSHMNLELIVSRLPQAMQAWTRGIVYLIVGSFSWFLLTQGSFLVNELKTATLSTMPSVSLGFSYLVLPVSGFIMVLFSVIKAVKVVMDYYIVKGGDQA
ncbi:MAG TPA: TRAP transporter small permease [Bacillota bacterium]|nr:TRAP transporter small permease [Bacillota bacterium]